MIPYREKYTKNRALYFTEKLPSVPPKSGKMFRLPPAGYLKYFSVNFNRV